MNANNNQKKHVMPVTLMGVLVTMAMILAACAPSATPATTTTVTQTIPTQLVSTGSTVTIDVATDPNLGKILVDNKGMTLYIFTRDKPDASTCDASCQSYWPPLVSSTAPKAGPGVDASLIGTAALPNGEKIVTYDHKPLYYFAKDTAPGQTSGEDVAKSWYVLSPQGNPVEPAASSKPTAVPTPVATQPSSGSTAPTPTATPITEPTIDIANNSTLGKILVANNGMTLYAYTEDTADTSNCGAPCQAVWKPLLTNGKPNLGSSIDASMIGTAKLADGSMIVTYNHMPLYTFVNDTTSGQTNGQGFDNIWYAVSADGKEVGKVKEVTINVATNPILGSYLVDGAGNAIYIFTKDTADTSTCNAACMANWPPVITLGNPNLGSGVDQTMIGTIKLADGSMMLTYNHRPLYYFVRDGKPADVMGQGIKSVWYVLGPDGNPITYLFPTPVTAEPTINVETNATYGQILADGNGMTLYADINDKKGESECVQFCLNDWTPLFTLGHPNIGSGINSSLVGTITTSYGMMIVTYNHQPLYLAKSDTKPGDITAEDANLSWYVMSVDGKPVVRR